MKKLLPLALVLSAASIPLYASKEYKKNEETKNYNNVLYALTPIIIALTTLNGSDQLLSCKRERSNEEEKVSYVISFCLESQKGQRNHFSLDYFDKIKKKHATIKATGTPGLYEGSMYGLLTPLDNFNEMASEITKLILNNPIEIFDRVFTEELNNQGEGYSIIFSFKDLKKENLKEQK